jgi:hypothetical protein
VVTLTDSKGKPLRRQSGGLVKHKLRDGENRNAIAKRLTLDHWHETHGTSADGGFNRRLDYPELGLA